ncbi:MAG: hypothetical protein NT149_02690 [Candidatus Gottesmanbacteria bacterium]|nr:hypothetical protein [Candidatus Gottesmanbacteria bacterium]
MSTKTDKITATVIKISIVVIVVFAVIVAARFIFGGSEDDWICVRGQWVMHGKPAAPRPTIPWVK